MTIKNLIITEKDFFSPQWNKALDSAEIITPDNLPPLDQTQYLVWIVSSIPQWQEICTHYEQLNHKVIVFSYKQSLHELKQALQAGAKGYISALSNEDVLKKVESAVYNGAIWIPGALIKELITTISKTTVTPPKKTELTSLLTPKETDITRLITQGMSNKSIAQTLNITERTVKAHLTHIFSKMKVKDRLQLSLKVKDIF